MSGITKCHGTGCPVRDECYRFTCVAHPFAQSYGGFPVPTEHGCMYIIDAKAREREKWEAAFPQDAKRPGEASEPEPNHVTPKLQ